MINTVTLNPSIDYVVNVPEFEIGVTNRSESEALYPGGKGINVAIVSQNLGHHVRTFGFLAGFSGEELRKQIKACGLRDEFVTLEKGITRINVKIKSGKETEINGSGPCITDEDMKKLHSKIENLEDGEYLVLAGSIPKSLSEDTYRKIMEDFAYKNFKVVVDATGKLLINVLNLRPFLIKPNVHELEEIFSLAIESEEEIITYMNKLQEMGARNVIVSMGKDGALMLTERGQLLKSVAPKGQLVNSVGAGDSMVAGFIVKFIETDDYEQAFRYSVATGSATAFSSGLATKAEVEELLKQMKCGEAI